MKLSAFLQNINMIVANRPEVLDFDVVYSIDDEGNDLRPVGFPPSIGVVDDGDFIGEDKLGDSEPATCICVN